jgi:spore germination protein KC
MRKQILLWLCLMLTVPSLAGCWSSRELTNIAFVIAVGIDKSEDNRYLLTMQIMNPRNSASMQQVSSSKGSPVNVYTGHGNTIVEAAREAMQHISRELYFSHANLVVIGEDLAREGVLEIFDRLERSPQFRRTSFVVIAKDMRATDLLKILTPIDQIPANKIIKTIKFSESLWGEAIKKDVKEAIDELSSSGKQLTLTGFSIEGNKRNGRNATDMEETFVPSRIISDKIGVFNNDRLIDWIGGETARGFLWTQNRIKSTIVNFDWANHKEAVSYRVVRSKTGTKAELSNGRPSVTVSVKVEGNIGETHVPLDLWDPAELVKLQRAIRKEIRKEILKSVEFAKEKKVDIFGFGEYFYSDHPKYWKRVKKEWNQKIFPELEVNVRVDAYIRRSDMRTKPYFYRMKGGE